jgi:thiamine biosynthesis protein ThiS
MEITVNGEPKAVPEGCTLRELAGLLELDASRVAVELDRVIVKAPLWSATVLRPGSKVEIVMFVGGG